MTIKFEPGQVYDVAHLRPFDLELALQGHPLATAKGEGVRAFRVYHHGGVSFDYWREGAFAGGWLPAGTIEPANTPIILRLAPLAVKDGRALHVGDEIDIMLIEFWRQHIITARSAINFFPAARAWRWPEAKEKQGL